MSISQLFQPNTYNLFANSVTTELGQGLQTAAFSTLDFKSIPNTNNYESVFQTPIMTRSRQDLLVEVALHSQVRQLDLVNSPKYTIMRHLTNNLGIVTNTTDLANAPDGLGDITQGMMIDNTFLDFDIINTTSFGVYYEVMAKQPVGAASAAGIWNSGGGRFFLTCRELAK